MPIEHTASITEKIYLNGVGAITETNTGELNINPKNLRCSKT